MIAAGFEGGQPPRRQPGISRAADLRTNQARPTPTPPEPEPVGVASSNNHSINHVSPAESSAAGAVSRRRYRSLPPGSRCRVGPATKMI